MLDNMKLLLLLIVWTSAVVLLWLCAVVVCCVEWAGMQLAKLDDYCGKLSEHIKS